MAHPYQKFRQHVVERSRVSDIAPSAPTPVGKSSTKIAAKVSPGKGSMPSAKIDGASTKPRLDKFARGGKVGKTNINIVIAPPQAGADAGLPPGGPPILAKPPMPPVAPPGAMAGPPGGPPGMPPMRSGGRAYASGGSVKAEGMRNGTPVIHSPGKNDQPVVRPKQITYAKGGGVKGYPLSAGAESAKGRLEKTRSQKKTYP